MLRFNITYLVFILLSLGGCTSTNEVLIDDKKINIGKCDIPSPEVVTSSSNHIILEYSYNDHDVVTKFAQEWCSKSNRIAKEEKYFCSECCQSSFQCR